MRVLVIVGLVACGAPAEPVRPVAPAPVAEPVVRERAEPEAPRPRPPEPQPRRPGEEVILLWREGQGGRALPHIEEKRSDLWDPCVRDVLQQRDAATRNAVGDALTGYVLTCDRTTQRIMFEPPQSPGHQTANTVIGLHGMLEPGRAEVALRVVIRIARTDAFERVTILAGRSRWTSPRLDVDHDPAAYEVAAIPFAPSLAYVVRRMLDAPDARVRFETATSYDEVIVAEQTKQDIRVLLDALNL